MKQLVAVSLLLSTGCFLGPAISGQAVDGDSTASDAGATPSDAGPPGDAGQPPADAGATPIYCREPCADGHVCVWNGDEAVCAIHDAEGTPGDQLVAAVTQGAGQVCFDTQRSCDGPEQCDDGWACDGTRERCYQLGTSCEQSDDCTVGLQCQTSEAVRQAAMEVAMDALAGRCLIDDDPEELLVGRVGFQTRLTNEDTNTHCRLAVCRTDQAENDCAAYRQPFDALAENASQMLMACAGLPDRAGSTCDFHECDSEEACVREYHFVDAICFFGWCVVGSDDYLSKMAHPMGVVFEREGEVGCFPEPGNDCQPGQLCEMTESGPSCAACTENSSIEGVECVNRRLYVICECGENASCPSCGDQYETCRLIEGDIQGRKACQSHGGGGFPPGEQCNPLCDQGTEHCVPLSFNGVPQPGYCAPASCNHFSDCPTGADCVEQVCAVPPFCSGPAHCAQGQECQPAFNLFGEFGACVRGECTSDADCGSHDVTCILNRCVAFNSGPDGCDNNAGDHFVTGRCQ